MITLIATVHVIIALVLIILVLIQDSKSDGALGMGGSSNSNSILGATGAQSLASKLTVVCAVTFAMTCLALTYIGAKSGKSVVDSLPLPVAPVTTPAGATTTPVSGAVATDAPPAATPAAVKE